MITAVTSGTAPAAPTFDSAATKTGGDFETFLKMLTTQLKNQDPLNPMESTDFAVQLATFSGVEQQALTNKLLGQMVGQSGGTNIASWIGKEARTTAPVWFGQQALTLDIAPDLRADDVILITKNAMGNTVSREQIGPGAGQIDWFGRDASGAKLADGRYSFAIQNIRAGEVISETAVGAYARVTGAEFTDKGTVLVFDGGATAPADEITALRGS
ncbi:flagellar hook capping FlgD N-terminal domain-containing protein [Paracoccus sp. (in: a-proteobacteria)]|uniref:flagellar hook capping FlgD N-terminal domain-containing protein n=1 Tax=Paracoccus sp. TaxID=267 RepID=UPI0026DF8EB1|nr:flagellar hook capping FlgD N-terminal domain-containing protein [Paracoccus sp. (in: a-proteobacteria)]MDO5647426.1 flagellar hook capping FlgD N-terminal domain-containing protein [Paracoccus sp. (in: a-proteobacteria)]